MAYRIDSLLLDFGGLFTAANPVVTGTLISVLPGTSTTLAPDTGAPIPGAPSTSVLFPAASSGTFPASIVLSDTAAPTGQLFRSGQVTLPPSPGQLTMITATGAVSASELATFGTSLGGAQISTSVGDAVKVLLGLFGLGPPESVTITSATVTPAASSLTIAINGSGTYYFLFIPFTQSFTITTTVTIAPSGDRTRTDRVVSVVAAGTTLTLVPQLFIIPFGMVDATLVNALEPMINRAIADAVDARLRALTPPLQRSPTSVISARRIVITGSGISAQIALADFGPAVVAPPPVLALSVTPAPKPNVEQTYTFRVINRTDQSPVAGATVTLTNRNPTTIQTQVTNAQGKAAITARLRAQIIGGGKVDPRVIQPHAVATAPGAQSATLVLNVFELL